MDLWHLCGPEARQRRESDSGAYFNQQDPAAVGADCNAANSALFTQRWHYSITHWVEDDPTQGDGAFSSPGAFGFYLWIEANKKYYGVISRYSAATGTVQNGLDSALCGHQLRAAWETGVAQ